MAVTLRLVRLGRRNRPFYRLRAADSQRRPQGRFIEDLGFVDPLAKDSAKQSGLHKERIEYWLGVGAKTSETVATLLAQHSITRKPKA